MEAQNAVDQDGQSSEVLDSIGVNPEEFESSSEDVLDNADTGSKDPLYVQKRLKQQKRAHDREIRELHSRMNDMQSRLEPQNNEASTYNPYSDQSRIGNVDEQIHKAVSYALQHRDMEERKAKEVENNAHIHRQYSDLNRHLDNVSDQYEDFDDVVRGDSSPFSPHMRDASLLLPKTGKGSAGEVLYKLGKNPEELSRIAKLHPLEQASEMVKLSHALINGSGREVNQNPSRPLGNIKSNPVSNSYAINEKTSISELRKRMKNGWK